MEIKELEKEYIESLADFFLNELDTTKSKEELINRINDIYNNENHVIFIVLDTCVLGYIHACIYDDIYHDKALDIISFKFNMKNKHSGIGRNLVTCIEDYARSKDIKEVRCCIDSERIHGHNIFKRKEYKNSETRWVFKKEM